MWTKSLYHNMLCPFITQWMPSRQKCWYTSSKCKRNINLNPVSYDYEPCFRNWGNLAIQGIGSGTLTKFMMLVRFCLSFWEQTSNDNGQKIWSVNLEITYSGKDRPWFLEKKKKNSERNLRWKSQYCLSLCDGTRCLNVNLWIQLLTRTTTLSSTCPACSRQSIVLQVR